jgi:hypothetical protein
MRYGVARDSRRKSDDTGVGESDRPSLPIMGFFACVKLKRRYVNFPGPSYSLYLCFYLVSNRSGNNLTITKVEILLEVTVQTTSYPMGTGGSFPGVEAAGAWSWPLTSN